jgi:hypothetical protein
VPDRTAKNFGLQPLGPARHLSVYRFGSPYRDFSTTTIRHLRLFRSARGAQLNVSPTRERWVAAPPKSLRSPERAELNKPGYAFRLAAALSNFEQPSITQIHTQSTRFFRTSRPCHGNPRIFLCALCAPGVNPSIPPTRKSPSINSTIFLYLFLDIIFKS